MCPAAAGPPWPVALDEVQGLPAPPVPGQQELCKVLAKPCKSQFLPGLSFPFCEVGVQSSGLGKGRWRLCRLA